VSSTRPSLVRTKPLPNWVPCHLAPFPRRIEDLFQHHEVAVDTGRGFPCGKLCRLEVLNIAGRELGQLLVVERGVVEVDM
jgi:hypothetical protein